MEAEEGGVKGDGTGTLCKVGVATEGSEPARPRRLRRSK